MKQILLAIDGNIPTQSVFQYALDLCKRIHAELNIIQFIKGNQWTDYWSKTRKNVGRLSKYLEDSFALAAFAEEGAFELAEDTFSDVPGPLKKMLPESVKAGVPVRVSVSKGVPEEELSDYVNQHHNIVMTIYDASIDEKNTKRSKTKILNQLRKKLYIPLVTVKR